MRNSIILGASQVTILLGMALACTSYRAWVRPVGLFLVFIGSFAGHMLISYLESELSIYRPD